MTDHIKIGDIQPWAQVEQTVAGTVDFEFPFPIFEDADLEVYVDAALKTLATDYTVSGAGADDGGAVAFAAAPPVGALVTLRRRLAVQRTSDFQETGEFRARVLNDELDYQTAAIQQVANDLERSVRLAATAPSIALGFTPAADKVLAVNAAGDGMTMGPSVTRIAEAGMRQCLSSLEYWDKLALIDIAEVAPYVGQAFDVTEAYVLRNVKE